MHKHTLKQKGLENTCSLVTVLPQEKEGLVQSATRTLAGSEASREWRTGSSICAQQQTSPSYSPKSQRTAGRSPAGKLASLHTAEPGDHDDKLLGTWAAPQTIYISLSSTRRCPLCPRLFERTAKFFPCARTDTDCSRMDEEKKKKYGRQLR